MCDGIVTGRGRRAAWVHRDEMQRRAAGPTGRPIRRTDLGRSDTRDRRLPSRRRAGRDLHRHRQRGLGHGVVVWRHLPARHQSWRIRQVTGGEVRVIDAGEYPADRPVLDRGGTGPHRRAVRGGLERCAASSTSTWPVATRRGRSQLGCLGGHHRRCGPHRSSPTWPPVEPRSVTCRPRPTWSSSGSSTRPMACSWSSTRRSAVASTVRWAMPCARSSVAASTSSSRPRRATTPSSSRSGLTTASR